MAFDSGLSLKIVLRKKEHGGCGDKSVKCKIYRLKETTNTLLFLMTGDGLILELSELLIRLIIKVNLSHLEKRKVQ